MAAIDILDAALDHTDSGVAWTAIGHAPADEPVASPQATVLAVHGAPESEKTRRQALTRPGVS